MVRRLTENTSYRYYLLRRDKGSDSYVIEECYDDGYSIRTVKEDARKYYESDRRYLHGNAPEYWAYDITRNKAYLPARFTEEDQVFDYSLPIVRPNGEVAEALNRKSYSIKGFNENYWDDYQEYLADPKSHPEIAKYVVTPEMWKEENRSTIEYFFKRKGWNTSLPEVQNYIDAVNDYLDMDDDWKSGNYTMQDWYKDTKLNYPEDIEWLDSTKNTRI